MSDEYLWDRSGPVDPEIEELEQTLSSLRYRNRPFEIPAVAGSSQRKFFRNVNLRLAIAAAIAFVVMGGVLLLVARKSQPSTPTVAAGKEASPISNTPANKPAAIDQSRVAESLPPRSVQVVNATYRNRFNAAYERRAEKIREATAAKDQLMAALRLASLKLTFAQKKAQDLNQHEQQIRISRKIG